MNYDEMKEYIKNSLRESLETGNVDVFHQKMEQKIKKLTQKDGITLLKALRDVQSEWEDPFSEAQSNLEPYYSSIFAILENIAIKDIDFYMTKCGEQPDSCLSLGEIYHNGAKVRKGLYGIEGLVDDAKVLKELDIIQTKYQYYETQKSFLESLLTCYPKNQAKEILEKIKLPDNFRHIRNAVSHSKVRPIPDNKTVKLRDYNPRTGKTWEKEYHYNEISDFLIQIVKWSVAFDIAKTESMKRWQSDI